MTNLQSEKELVKEYLESAIEIESERFPQAQDFDSHAERVVEIAKMIQMAHRWSAVKQTVSKSELVEPTAKISIPKELKNVKLPKGTKRLYIDGGCSGNGQKKQKAKIAITTDKEVIYTGSIGNFTSNEAEFVAAEYAMTIIKNNLKKGDEITIFSDSKIATNMINEDWKGKKQHLKDHRDRIVQLKGDWSIPMVWIPRDSNFAGIYLEFGNLKGDKK